MRSPCPGWRAGAFIGTRRRPKLISADDDAVPHRPDLPGRRPAVNFPSSARPSVPEGGGAQVYDEQRGEDYAGDGNGASREWSGGPKVARALNILPALLYLQWHSARNRTVARLRRLKQPKYLFGALFGLAYLYANFLRFFLPLPGTGRLPGRSGDLLMTPELAALSMGQPLTPIFETLGALVLVAVVLLAWLVPRERAALIFTEAEIAFLFPAPVSRRALIHWKLLRSQFAILLTIAFLTLVTGRFRLGVHVWTQAAGWWVILSTLSLHLLGVSFARTLLLERGLTPWRRRAVILLAAAGVLGAAAWWARESVPPFALAAGQNPDPAALLTWVRALLEAPAIHWLLEPFRVPLRPFLAADAGGFARALGPAAAVLGMHYLWVLRADVAFEEASADLSRRHAARLADLRSGRGAAVPFRRRRAPFPLAPTGGPRVIALLWKNLLAAGGLFSVRTLLFMVWLTVCFGFGLSQFLHHSPWPTLLGVLAVILAGFLLVFGSMMTRHDLRSDLGNVDLLKTYPLPGWQIVLGELLAPAVLLTVGQWLLLLLAAGLFARGADPEALDLWVNLAAPMAAAAVLAPAWNLLSLLIPNAAVLFLPGWFQTGTTAGAGSGAAAGGRGIEVLGQRLIFLLGQMLVLTVALLPAVGVGGAVGLGVALWLGSPTTALLAGSAAGAAVLLGEVALALGPLGDRFDRFDLSAELRPRG